MNKHMRKAKWLSIKSLFTVLTFWEKVDYLIGRFILRKEGYK